MGETGFFGVSALRGRRSTLRMSSMKARSSGAQKPATKRSPPPAGRCSCRTLLLGYEDGQNDDREARRSTAVREFIEKYQPDIVVCGHIHESRAVDSIGKTRIVNVGMAEKGYFAIIERVRRSPLRRGNERDSPRSVRPGKCARSFHPASFWVELGIPESEQSAWYSRVRDASRAFEHGDVTTDEFLDRSTVRWRTLRPCTPHESNRFGAYRRPFRRRAHRPCSRLTHPNRPREQYQRVSLRLLPQSRPRSSHHPEHFLSFRIRAMKPTRVL